MPGDKVNRVKSIRKWLEKAEKSYSSHKELSGELNLIMARAEMNRLDEVHDWTRKKNGLSDVQLWLWRSLSLQAVPLCMTGCRQNQVRQPHQPVEVRCRQRYQKLPHRIQMKI